MLENQVLMELADASYLVAGVKLDIPVRTRNKILKSLFENFLWVGLNRRQLLRRQVILIRCVFASVHIC